MKSRTDGRGAQTRLVNERGALSAAGYDDETTLDPPLESPARVEPLRTLDPQPEAAHPADEAIATFLGVDRVGAVAGLIILSVANVFIGSREVWGIGVAILVLILALTWARSQLGSGRRSWALAAATGGNWLVAMAVAAVIPQLWPVMVLTVLMPVVLATPLLHARAILGLLVAAAFAAAIVSALGLTGDDGGVLPDLEDELELLLVTSALVGHLVPVGLIVWNNTRLQQHSLHALQVANVDLRQSRSALVDSRRRIVEAADRERRRVERDLHDGAQQHLIALRLQVQMLADTIDPNHHRQIDGLAGAVDSAIEELRRLAHGLYPPLLESHGLGAALSSAARSSPQSVLTSFADIDRLQPEVERALYFVALEALANAHKHAGPSTIEIALTADDGVVELRVEDDGVGFNASTVDTTHGTLNMADRMAAIGGAVLIESTPGMGAVVTATAPMAGAHPTPHY